MDIESPDDMLLSDYLFKMRKTDEDAHDGWSCNWDELANPVPRNSWSTLILLMNKTQNPVSDFKAFFGRVNNIPGVAERGRVTWKLFKRDIEGRHNVTIHQNRSIIMKGFLTDVCDPHTMDCKVGKNYCMLLSKNLWASVLQGRIHKGVQDGRSVLLHHSNNEFEVGGYNDELGYTVGGTTVLKVVAVTGLASGDETGYSLATRLSLVKEDPSKGKTDLARCHITYMPDGSLNPTIEMISVHQKHRGKDLLPLLGKITQCFVTASFRLECLIHGSSPGHMMMSATKFTNCIIERRYFEDGSCVTVTDKDYFFYHAGFCVSQPKGVIPPLTRSVQAQQGHEAISYVELFGDSDKPSETPLKDSVADIMEDRSLLWQENVGALACDACGKFSKEMLLCSLCRTNHYCNATCQKNDWKPRHKAWCGKTRDQVRAILVEKGRL